jgi:Tfp pilus assembly PilM family ATPase
MAQRNEIASTEKLLDVIRGKKESISIPASPAGSARKPASGGFGMFAGGIKLSKNETIGVDIGRRDLFMARVLKTSGSWRLLGNKRVPIDGSLDRDSREFRDFLKSEITRFCGSGNGNIWAIMSAAQVDIRFVRIPKVPPKHIKEAVYWAVKKETPLDEQNTVIDYNVRGEVLEQGASKLSVMVCIAPREEVERVKGLFSSIGITLKGLTITPLAIENVIRSDYSGGAKDTERNLANLFLGNEFSRIDIFTDGNVAMIRDVNTGVKSLEDALVESSGEIVVENPPLTPQRAREILVKINREMASLGKLPIGAIRAASPGYPGADAADDESPIAGVDESPIAGVGESSLAGVDEPGVGGFGTDGVYEPPASRAAAAQTSPEQLCRIIDPAMERLVRQVERTLEHFSSTYEDTKVDKICVSSVLPSNGYFVNYIETQLGIPSESFDPLADILSTMDGSERNSFLPSIGVALSDTKTPNFIFTHKEKIESSAVSKINMAVTVISLIALTACAGAFLKQRYVIWQKKSVVADLQRQMQAFEGLPSRAEVERLALKIATSKQKLVIYGNRYLNVATIGELAEMTPSYVTLTGLKVNVGGAASGGKSGATETPAAKAEPEKTADAKAEPEKTGGKSEPEKPAAVAKGEQKSGSIVVKGIIVGDKTVLESHLVSYVKKLSGSPLFGHIILVKSSMETLKNVDFLRFELKIGGQG